MTARILRLDPSLPPPSYATPGSVAFDLRARIGVQVRPGELVMVPTGLVIEVPEGHALKIYARSSVATKRWLLMPHGVGIIDRDYCGDGDEIQVPLLNWGTDDQWVEAGDRIAQGMIVAVPRVEFVEVEAMARENRGGFGSTGR